MRLQLEIYLYIANIATVLYTTLIKNKMYCFLGGTLSAPVIQKILIGANAFRARFYIFKIYLIFCMFFDRITSF